MGANSNKYSGPRRDQHKPSRETKAKELTLLKNENKSLKKQNARLKRQLQEFKDGYTEASEAAIEAAQELHVEIGQAVELRVGHETVKNACQGCGSRNLVELQVPTGTMQVCKDCKMRRKV